MDAHSINTLSFQNTLKLGGFVDFFFFLSILRLPISTYTEMDERCCELTECYFVDGFFNFEQPVLTASRVKGLITREGL